MALLRAPMPCENGIAFRDFYSSATESQISVAFNSTRKPGILYGHDRKKSCAKNNTLLGSRAAAAEQEKESSRKKVFRELINLRRLVLLNG